jgi:hypothetical protein
MSSSPPSGEGSACSGLPVEWFYPDSRIGKQFSNSLLALRACHSCQNVSPCLDYALSWEEHGIWGGTTEAERRYIRRTRGIKLMTRSPWEIELAE